MQTIYKIFQELSELSPINADSFTIASLPSIKNHKLGISLTRQPMFFIKCDTSIHMSLDINLEYISVQYNRQCQLINKKNVTEQGTYTIISLKTDSEDLQEYFLKIVFLLVKNVSEQPLLKDLKGEVDKLINLFNQFSKPPMKTIQGLWAELLMIEQSRDPKYLIQSWHNSIYDKFDFNDGIDKIEVKSTTKDRRIHRFSLSQLRQNPSSKLMIVSILTVETGIGISIFGLVEKIEKKIENTELSYQINEMITKTLGQDFEKAFDIFYDYKLGVDSIEYYDAEDIPMIHEIHIPSNIFNIVFDCDLTNITTTNRNSKSVLHNSLF